MIDKKTKSQNKININSTSPVEINFKNGYYGFNENAKADQSSKNSRNQHSNNDSNYEQAVTSKFKQHSPKKTQNLIETASLGQRFIIKTNFLR